MNCQFSKIFIFTMTIFWGGLYSELVNLKCFFCNPSSLRNSPICVFFYTCISLLATLPISALLQILGQKFVTVNDSQIFWRNLSSIMLWKLTYLLFLYIVSLKAPLRKAGRLYPACHSRSADNRHHWVTHLTSIQVQFSITECHRWGVDPLSNKVSSETPWLPNDDRPPKACP